MTIPKTHVRKVVHPDKPCRCGTGNYCHQHEAYNLKWTDTIIHELFRRDLAVKPLDLSRRNRIRED